ncbi:MAG: type 1 glutamine amidotransferase domain-containing protein [Candidatus Methylomirabilales bacterium]
MRIQGRRIAIVAENLYQEMELWVPYYRLKEEGGTVNIIGTGTAKTYTSKHGYPVSVDAAADEVKGADFDAVIIPGGFAPDLMRRSAAMVRLVREAFEAGKVVAAICHGGWLLCSAGVLRGKTATGFFSIKDDMVNAGARFIDQEVVVDGSLITSRKPDDLPAFCRELVNALEKAG